MIRDSDVTRPRNADEKCKKDLRVKRVWWNNVFKSVYELTNHVKLRLL